MRALLSIGVLLAVTSTGSALQNRPAGPPPGRLVDVGGRSLHIRCVGPATGGPTVILEAGAGDYSNRWTAVQGMPQDNADLHALLTAAAVPGPYVLVGHSLGALLVRRYALHYPDGIVGLVLAGPTHENTRLFSPLDNQWKRMREQAMGADFQELYLARQANPVALGNRPVIVVVGTRADWNVPTPDEIAQEKAAELEDQPRISTNSTLVRDPSSGHHIHVDNPALVAGAIEEVVAAATSGTRLRGAGAVP